MKQKYGIKKDDIVFTFIGRFTDDKGIDKLLEALRLLQDTSKVKCLIVGKIGYILSLKIIILKS